MNSTTTPRDATRPKRSHAVLAVLVALFGASLVCIVAVFDAAADVDAAQATQQRASQHRAVVRRARIRSAEAIVADATAASIPEPRTAARAGTAIGSSRHPGGRPDAATPRGMRLFDDLLAAARREPDAKKRTGAVRSLAGMFGRDASDALTGIADDPTQPAEVRDVAANVSRQRVEGGK